MMYQFRLTDKALNLGIIQTPDRGLPLIKAHYSRHFFPTSRSHPSRGRGRRSLSDVVDDTARSLPKWCRHRLACLDHLVASLGIEW